MKQRQNQAERSAHLLRRTPQRTHTHTPAMAYCFHVLQKPIVSPDIRETKWCTSLSEGGDTEVDNFLNNLLPVCRKPTSWWWWASCFDVRWCTTWLTGDRQEEMAHGTIVSLLANYYRRPRQNPRQGKQTYITRQTSKRFVCAEVGERMNRF